MATMRPLRSSLTIAFAAYGLRIAIDVFDEDVGARLEALLPPDRTPADGDSFDRRYRLEDRVSDPSARYAFYVDDDEDTDPRTSATIDGILEILEGDIQIYVAEFASPHLFVHAGVVEWKGKAIVLPGSSFAGKSTLVTSLLHAGALYYSDEYALFDPQGRVHPYRRLISLRPGPHGEGRLDATDWSLRDEEETSPLPVGLVALLRYNAEAGWDVTGLEGAAAVMAICEHTVAIQRRPADTLSILGTVVAQTPVIQGTRGDVDDTVDRLLEIVDSTDHS